MEEIKLAKIALSRIEGWARSMVPKSVRDKLVITVNEADCGRPS